MNEEQREALLNCWLKLIDAISREASVSVDEIVGSPEGNTLFRSIALDHPDVLVLRWLHARKWDVDAAVDQLMGTLNGRYEWGVDTLLAKGENDLLQEEILLGKTYFLGRDKQDRPINSIHVKDHIKDQFPIEATEKLGILSVETSRKLLPNSIVTGTVVLDLDEFGVQNMNYQLVKFFLHLLENYYPETLGLALVLHAPLVFYSWWAIIHLILILKLSSMKKIYSITLRDFLRIAFRRRNRIVLEKTNRSSFKQDHTQQKDMQHKVAQTKIDFSLSLSLALQEQYSKSCGIDLIKKKLSMFYSISI